MWIHPRITAAIVTTAVTLTKTLRIGSRVELLMSSSSENVKRKKTTSVRIMPLLFTLYVKKKKNTDYILIHSHYNVILF